MLNALSELLAEYWGPFRLLASLSFLATMGMLFSFILSYLLLPKISSKLPKNSGREFAFNGNSSIGKAQGAGVILVLLWIFTLLIFSHWNSMLLSISIALLASSFIGFIDDIKKGGLSGKALGIFDLLIAMAIVFFLKDFTNSFWIPLSDSKYELPQSISYITSVAIVWLAVNSMNCTDGVDGLTASLSIISFASLAGFLYFTIGNPVVSEYLLLPYLPYGQSLASALIFMVGILAGYLWFNAPPSSILMGDSGSRPLGMLLGISIVLIGNPFFLLMFGALILINGATGLVKVALIKYIKLNILRNVRFPLHDEFRHKRSWSDAQVLVRFSILHTAFTILLIVAFIKIR